MGRMSDRRTQCEHGTASLLWLLFVGRTTHSKTKGTIFSLALLCSFSLILIIFDRLINRDLFGRNFSLSFSSVSALAHFYRNIAFICLWVEGILHPHNSCLHRWTRGSICVLGKAKPVLGRALFFLRLDGAEIWKIKFANRYNVG